MEPIRRARAEDCAELAKLILLSDSGLLSALFPGGPCTTICYLAAHPKNPFSYEHAWVIEKQGTVVGGAVGSCGLAMRRERFSTARLIAQHYGLRAPARFAELARAGAATGGVAEKDFYLKNIAVLPGARGKGLGRRLLLAVEAAMHEQGAVAVVLDVDVKNVRAAAFYEALGYREERIIALILGRGEIFRYRRLRKSLSEPPRAVVRPTSRALR